MRLLDGLTRLVDFLVGSIERARLFGFDLVSKAIILRVPLGEGGIDLFVLPVLK